MKKILHISTYYPPHTGGVEQVCHMIVSSAPEYEHEVICFNDCPKTIVSFYEGVKVIRVGAFAKVASQALSFSYMWRLRAEIKSFNPNIIHFHVPNPLIGFYLCMLPQRIPLIVHYHAEILTSAFLYACYRPFERLLFHRAKLIITTSPKLRDEAKPLVPYRKKCEILANAINTRQFDLGKIEKEKIHIQEIQARYGNRKIILSYGRHVPYKGLCYLIEAEKYIKEECVLLIGGEGPLTSQLQMQANSPRIHFLGRIPDNQLKYYLYAAEIFAFPSITKAEAFGITLIENMYCYTPPVTFSIPASGVNYVCLNGVTGLVVPNSNTMEFARAIDQLLSDDTLRLKMAEAGHQRVEKLFTTQTFSEKLKDIYDQIIHEQNQKC